MGRKEMESELRQLRSEKGAKPISKMRMTDISAEIERYKVGRAETPPIASYPTAPVKASRSAVESVKEAKESEFPVEPVERVSPAKKNLKSKSEGKSHPAPVKAKETKAKPETKAKAPVKSKGKSKMERIAELLEGDSD